MSIRFIGTVWDSGLYDGPRLLMMLALADHADDDGWCFPNYETLALKIRRNVKTVYRVLSDLEAEGAIRRQDGRIGIVEPHIIEEVYRRAEASKAKPPTPKNQSKFLKYENSVLNSEKPILTSEKEILTSEKPFYIDPSINHHSNRERENGAVAPPTPTPNGSPQFQPIPENVKKAKARRGDVEPEPAIISAAPAAVQLVSRLTNSWPGEHLTADLVALFGENPDEAALAEAVRQWRLAGFRMTNYGGIGEWYQELIRDPTWTPGTRFKRNSNLKGDPNAREAHNRAIFEQVAQEINTGDWTPWTTDSNT